jgi:hypothetical protein
VRVGVAVWWCGVCVGGVWCVVCGVLCGGIIGPDGSGVIGAEQHRKKPEGRADDWYSYCFDLCILIFIVFSHSLFTYLIY